MILSESTRPTRQKMPTKAMVMFPGDGFGKNRVVVGTALHLSEIDEIEQSSETTQKALER